jgi:hypothetical protein
VSSEQDERVRGYKVPLDSLRVEGEKEEVKERV